MPDFYRPIEPFSIQAKSGLPRTFTPDQVVGDDDPDFKGREALFEPVQAKIERATLSRAGAGRAAETASAAPGEKRVRTVPVPNPPIQ